MDPRDGARREGSAENAAVSLEVGVNGLDHGRREVSDLDLAEAWMEVAAQHRAVLANGVRKPVHRGDRVPGVEQFRHRRTHTDTRQDRTLATMSSSSRSASARLARTVLER